MNGLMLCIGLALAFPLACWLSDRSDEKNRARWVSVESEGAHSPDLGVSKEGRSDE